MGRRKDWFDGFFAEAELFARSGRDHGLLESVLGIARELDAGNERAARKIYESARPQLFRLRTGERGETDSTQVRRMLGSNIYPRDVRDRIRSLLGG